MPPSAPSLLESLVLERRPRSRDVSLRAWDGADASLLEHAERHLDVASAAAGRRVLVVNDAFGALAAGTVAMGEHEVTTWGDSHVAWMATSDNLRANGLGTDATAVTFVPSTSEPSGASDLVLLRVPRSTALLASQVGVLAGLAPGTTVLAAGMDKHLPERTRAELEVLGAVTTHRGERKAHVFEVVVDDRASARAAALATEPTTRGIDVPGLSVPLEGGIGVFSHDRLDLGARVLVEALRTHGLPDGDRVLDLGCGNGVLGCTARMLRPSIDLTMVDESHEAVAVSRRNHALVASAIDGAVGAVECRVDDGLSAHDGAPFDVVLCNPPFHQQHVVDDAVAWSMLAGVRPHLADDGTVVVVANRHLGWHARLRRLFPSVHVVADHPKFVVLAAHGRSAAR